METKGRRSQAIFALALTVICFLITFLTDRSMFIFPSAADERYRQALTDYIICKCAVFVILLVVFWLISVLIFTKGDLKDRLTGVLKCAALYLPVVIAVLVIKLPQGFITNDEYAISNDALNLIHDTWFNYLTVYYYIISYMLIPIQAGPIITKVIIQVLCAGYSIFRTGRYLGKKGGAFMYVLFLLYPVIAYTTSAHRLPIYFLIYLTVFEKLLFDRLEGEKGDRDMKGRNLWTSAGLLLLAGAVLTQWRTEGIYLLILLPILIFMAYPALRTRRNMIIVIAVYGLLQYLIGIPQGLTSAGLSDAANDRMKPFYAYTITNMYRNGLDRTANAKDLEAVDGYLSVDAIERINEHYVDINYEDVLILIDESFEGVRKDASYEQYVNFTDAVKNMIVNNPGVFLRTRWGAFCYSALPYHMTFSAGSMRELLSSALSVVKTVSYNLFIPLGFVLAGCIYCLIARRWYSFFVAGGLAAHWAIVFILAPASYFKYYFPVYIMAYFYIILLIIWAFAKRRNEAVRPVI